MEVTKPKVNVKRFSRSKTEEPSELPIIEKKTKGKKKYLLLLKNRLNLLLKNQL